MIRIFKKQISLLLAGSFSVVLAACYGAPVDMQDSLALKTLDSNDNPIEGLKVSLKNNDYIVETSYTDADGQVLYPNLNSNTTYKVNIEDVDGELNGGLFIFKEIDITDNYNINVIMEK